MKTYTVYILTNAFHNVLYIGMTNDIERRLAEHRSFLIPGFSKRYKTTKLVYMEQTSQVEAAIAREKEFKGWRRSRKDALVTAANPDWNDLSAS